MGDTRLTRGDDKHTYDDTGGNGGCTEGEERVTHATRSRRGQGDNQ